MEQPRHDSDSSGKSLVKDAVVDLDINERKLMAKIDFRVIPVLSFLYFLAFLDRTNIGKS